MTRKILFAALATVILAACGATVDLGSKFTLKYGASAGVKDTNLKIQFQDVVDNRCPTGNVCDEEGSAEITLKISSDSEQVATVILDAGEADIQFVNAFGYQISVYSLNPHPESGVVADKKDLSVELSVIKQLGLTEAYWELESYGPKGDEPTMTPQGTGHVVSFYDGKIKINDRCNASIADYEALADGSIELTNLLMAVLDCEWTQDQIDQDSYFWSVVNDIQNQTSDNEKLFLTSGNEEVLTFKGTKKVCGVESYFPDGLGGEHDICVLNCLAGTPSTLSCHPFAQQRECNHFCDMR